MTESSLGIEGRSVTCNALSDIGHQNATHCQNIRPKMTNCGFHATSQNGYQCPRKPHEYWKSRDFPLSDISALLSVFPNFDNRDSFGHKGVVHAGGAQWMRAGRGILHAEKNLPELAPTIHGLQVWARLPIAQQDCEPQYKAIAASDVPAWEENGIRLRLLSGAYAGRVGPIMLATPSLLLHVLIPAAGSWSLGEQMAGFEIAVYGISGQASLAETAIRRGDCAVLGQQETLLSNGSDNEAAEIIVLGGSPAERPLVFGGPFVLDSKDRIQSAYENFHSGRMGTLDGVPH